MTPEERDVAINRGFERVWRMNGDDFVARGVSRSVLRAVYEIAFGDGEQYEHSVGGIVIDKILGFGPTNCVPDTCEAT